MKFTLATLALGAATLASAADSLCDKYTTAALKNNTSENQLTLLTLLVNTVVIGNYSSAALPGMMVPGILAKGNVNGTDVNLAPYFDGSLASSNVDGKATAVNWLDGGGAAPLMQNKPANDMNSMQYTLLTHLYQVFGTLLGCSLQGSGMAFNSYQGDPSMSRVHRFMNLNTAETTYFVQQVGAAAASFGVTSDDITTVANALVSTFNYKCAPAVALASGAPAASQSICTAADCPTAKNSDCASTDISYGNGTGNVEPAMAGSSTSGSGTSNTGSSGSTKPASAGRMVIDTVAALGLAGAAVAAAALL